MRTCNMKLYVPFIICFSVLLLACESKEEINLIESKSLRLERIAPNTFIHTSYLKEYNNFPCNGMLVIQDGDAIVYDTPTDNGASNELINWIQDELHCKVKAVVSTHFHTDCLGGLAAFHAAGVASYASFKTIKLANEDSVNMIPQNGFKDYLELPIGDQKVVHEFLGAGHTLDNIIAYFPTDQVLFGGCLIKEVDAGKGNLTDAHTDAWPTTVRKVKAKYKQAKIIIPGHGKHGGHELLDYTIKLFEK